MIPSGLPTVGLLVTAFAKAVVIGVLLFQPDVSSVARQIRLRPARLAW